MLNKLQIHSLITSFLLLPALALTAYPSSLSFNNATNYPISEVSISSIHMEKSKENTLAEDIFFGN